MLALKNSKREIFDIIPSYSDEDNNNGALLEVPPSISLLNRQESI